MNNHPGSDHDASGGDAGDPGAVNLSRLDPTRDATAFDREIRSIASDAIAERTRRRATRGARRINPRRLSIGLLAAAASLALLVGGIEGRRRSGARRTEHAMTTASAIVIQRHLAQSDTMIDAFRSAVASKTWDAQLTTRARSLELATRRIQGGRIEADSTLAGLLVDLDLVLTEIVGYGDLTAHRDTESNMIEYSIRVRSVVPRLRAVSATVSGRATPNEGSAP